MTMTSTTSPQQSCCGRCSDGTVSASGGTPGAAGLERPRYYPRQMMTPAVMTLGDDYFRARLRRHNRYLHGWGVVCGALVCTVPAKDPADGTAQPWVVQVQPGFVVTPTGDEVEIGAPQTLSLRPGATASWTTGDDWSDPWCTEVWTDRPAGPVHVAVRYQEVPVQPVLSQPGGCGCGDNPCEYSRYRDGFVLGVLDSCTDQEVPAPPTGNPVCPAAVASPWVVLAEVTLDTDGTVTRIDNCACRRILDPASWRRCDTTDADHVAQDEPPSPRGEGRPGLRAGRHHRHDR